MNLVTRSEFREVLLSLYGDIQNLREEIRKPHLRGDQKLGPQEDGVLVKIDPGSSIETRTPETEQKKQSHYQFWTILVLGLTLVAVGAYAFITAKMWREMQRQSTTAQQQFEAMDRPWVDFDISVSAPITYDATGLHVTVTFFPKNIGRSPAQSVSIAPRLVPGSMGTDIHEVQRRICEARATAKDESLAYVLFPTRSYSEQITMQITDAEINS